MRYAFNCDERGPYGASLPRGSCSAVCASHRRTRAIGLPPVVVPPPCHSSTEARTSETKPPPAANEDPDTERSPPPESAWRLFDRGGEPRTGRPPARCRGGAPHAKSQKKNSNTQRTRMRTMDDAEEFSDPPESMEDSPTLVDPQPEGDPDPQEERILNSQGTLQRAATKGEPHPTPAR